MALRPRLLGSARSEACPQDVRMERFVVLLLCAWFYRRLLTVCQMRVVAAEC